MKVVQEVAQGPSVALEGGDEFGHHQRRADSVLVPDHLAHRVAERFLVTQHQVVASGPLRVGRQDPLEAGERLGPIGAVSGRDERQQARRHHRVDHQPAPACARFGPVVRSGPAKQVFGQQATRLVAGQQPPAPALGHRHRQAVGIGVVGQGYVRARVCGQIQQPIDNTGLLGVGKRGGYEIGIGLGLLGHDCGRVEPGAGQGPQERLCPHAVKRCVGRAHRPRSPRRQQSRHRVQVGLHQFVAGGLDADVVVGTQVGLGQWRSAVDDPADLGVDRGGQLLTAPPVDLAAVVGARVVAGGHHHPGRRVEMLHREGQHRGGHRPRQHRRPDSAGDQHSGRVDGEAVAPVAGVVSDHHRRALLALLAHPLGQRRGHDPHQHPVHAERARPHPAPNAGGPEGEPPLESPLEIDPVAGQKGFEFRARVGVGIGGQPRLGPPPCGGGQCWWSALLVVGHGCELPAVWVVPAVNASDRPSMPRTGRQRSTAAAVVATACSKDASALVMCSRISSLAQSALPEATAS